MISQGKLMDMDRNIPVLLFLHTSFLFLIWILGVIVIALLGDVEHGEANPRRKAPGINLKEY
jgi:hypothetical protein